MALGQLTSQRLGYAVHCLAYMAKKPQGELTTLPEVAEWLGKMWPKISPTYLSNVYQRLARGGILQSHRGISGGYSLARPADQITMRHLVELLEGVALERCSLSLEGQCPIEGICGIQNRLRAIEHDYLASLDQLTIAELAKSLSVQLPKASAKSRA